MENDKTNAEKKERYESKRIIIKENRTPIAGIVLLLLLIIGFLAAILLPYKVLSSTETVPYTAIEEYNSTEPYLTTSQVKVQVPVDKSKCDYQTPSYYVDTSSSAQGNQRGVTCSILNFASIPTDFIYYIYTTDSMGKVLNKTGEKRVTVDSQDLFLTTELMPTASGYGCYVKPQIQAECTSIIQFKEATKDQLTVKQKQVIKLRTVTKYRTDTLYKKVNLLFGVQMPWHNSWKEYGTAPAYFPINSA